MVLAEAILALDSPVWTQGNMLVVRRDLCKIGTRQKFITQKRQVSHFPKFFFKKSKDSKKLITKTPLSHDVHASISQLIQ